MTTHNTLLLMLAFVFVSCTSTKIKDSQKQPLDLELQERNRATVSLLDRLRRIPGIIVRRNTPYILSNSADSPTSTSSEPLYVLDGYPIGNSFRDVSQLAQNVDVKTIEILKGSEASFYGSRAGAGVIIITTYKE